MRIFEPQNGVRIKGFFILFYPFALDLDILFLSSPDFSSILDIFFYHFLSFFYPLVLDLDILFLSSPDFSSILDILFLSFFYPFYYLFLSFFYHFLSSCPLPGDPFPYHPVNFPEFWISFLNPFCILLSLTWISFLYPLVLDLDKKRINKG